MYLPCLPRDIQHMNDKYVPVPEFVTLTNLRKVVEALASEETPATYRNAFRQSNPIPTTR